MTVSAPLAGGRVTGQLAAPSWRALLIGGASGVGKTALARHYGVSLLLVDDVRMAL